MQLLYSLTSSPALAWAVLIIVSIAIATMPRWLASSRLRDRQQFDDSEFEKTFFPAEPDGDTAVRVRRVLAENLDMDLGGLRPDDKLDDDLKADLSTNVDLFFELEREFQIDCRVHDLAVFERTTTELITFADLVRFVQNEVRGKSETDGFSADQRDSGFDGQDLIGYAWFTGLGVTVLGSIVNIDWLFTAGLTIAFVPVIVGVGYEVVTAISNLVKAIRDSGCRNVLRHPTALIIWFAVLVPFLGIGIWLSLALFDLYFGRR